MRLDTPASFAPSFDAVRLQFLLLQPLIYPYPLWGLESMFLGDHDEVSWIGIDITHIAAHGRFHHTLRRIFEGWIDGQLGTAALNRSRITEQNNTIQHNTINLTIDHHVPSPLVSMME